jgi:hypothetical protein
MPTETIKIYQSSFGFKIRFDVVDGSLDSTSNMQLRIKPPTGSVVSKELSSANITDVAAGIVEYDVVEGDFPQVGTYILQLIDTTPGRFLPGDPIKIKTLAIIST